jgi:hypothetical protein
MIRKPTTRNNAMLRRNHDLAKVSTLVQTVSRSSADNVDAVARPHDSLQKLSGGDRAAAFDREHILDRH